MAKRFPIPEFDYEELKGRSWTAPEPITGDELEGLLARARDGDAAAWGAWVVAAGERLFAGLDRRGDWRFAVLCLLPAAGVTMTGRSHAWSRQWLAALDGPPGASPSPLLIWQTPRPMNTRLGPEDGIEAPAAVLTLVCGHLYGDHRVGNRCIADNAWQPATGNGFRVLFADDPQRNDFHAAVVTFSWND